MEKKNEFLDSETSVEEANEAAVEQASEIEKVFCAKCGAEVASGNAFCPKCGHKVGEKTAPHMSYEPEPTNPAQSSKKTPVGIIAGAVVAIIAIIAIIAIVAVMPAGGGQPKDEAKDEVKGVNLEENIKSLKVGEDIYLSYTIEPSDAEDDVTWESSNESIAQVTNGVVKGVSAGECTITVSTKNGKTDTCSITILPAVPDLLAIYEQYCSSSFASLGSDKSYLNIDTNPNDKDDYIDFGAYSAIESVNEALGLPESVLNRMEQTRALDGIQTYSNDVIEVSWTYHPDQGLEVTYSLKD